jgi:hypothetical protein
MLVLANLAAFFVIFAWLGGDADGGREIAGRYYLGNHGTLIEVSRDVFRYSEVYGIITLVSFVLAFALDWLMILSRTRTKL